MIVRIFSCWDEEGKNPACYVESTGDGYDAIVGVWINDDVIEQRSLGIYNTPAEAMRVIEQWEWCDFFRRPTRH